MDDSLHSTNQSRLLFPIALLGNRWRAFLPLVCGLIIACISFVFSNTPMSLAGIPTEHHTVAAAQLEHAYYNAIDELKSTDPTGEKYLHPYAWISSALVVTLLLIVNLTLSIYTFVKEVRRRWVVASVLPLAFFCGVLGVVVYLNKDQTLIEIPMSILLLIDQTVPKPPVTMFMDWLLWWESLMLVAALCALSSQFAPGKDMLATLIRRKYLLTCLLYVSAVTLTISVPQVNLLYRMPGNAVAMGLSEAQYNNVAAGITMITGTYFTVLLAVIFLPVLLILRAEAHAIAVRQANVSTQKELDEWLKDNGFDGSWKQQLSRIAALIGPILAGWLSEPVVQALAM